MTKSPPGLADYGLLTLLAAIFGAAFILIAITVRDIPPMTMVAVRQGVAALLFGLFMVRAGQSLPKWGPVWWPIFGAAILGNALPFFLIAWGQEVVPAGRAAILTSSTPILALVVGFFLAERILITPRRILAVLLGFAGVVILFGIEKLQHMGEDAWRQLALLAAALCYACNAFILARISNLPRRATITAVLGISSLVMWPFCLAMDQPWNLSPGLASIIALLLLAVFSTAFGNLLRFEIVDRQGAMFLTQLSYLIPVFGLFWAWLILDEIIGQRTWIALALIFVGIWLSRTDNLQTKRNWFFGRQAAKSRFEL